MRFFGIIALSLLTGILAAPVAVPNPEAYDPPPQLSLSLCLLFRDALVVREAEPVPVAEPSASPAADAGWCRTCMIWRK